MPQSWPHDPQAELDYSISWLDWLASGETISTSSWAAEVGITIMSDAGHLPSKTDTTTTVWLTGGTIGARYNVINTITTSAGRKEERTITMMVGNR